MTPTYNSHNRFVSLILTLALTLPAAAQYAIPWNTLEPGAVSRGGPYSLRGMTAQPDAFVQTGEPYRLAGGFLPGLNGCRVDLDGLLFLHTHWLETGTAGLDAIAPVDLLDFNLLSTLWLTPCPGSWPVP